MTKFTLEVSEKLWTALENEAGRMDLAVDSLVEGLVKKFLQKQNAALETTQDDERRTAPRVKIKQAAILYFETDGGKYGLYKSGDLKDIAAGGVLVECDTSVGNGALFKAGAEFDLIFQLTENQPPLRVQCKVCRVMQNNAKTRLGVAFSNANEETCKMLLNLPELSRSERDEQK
jgi:hypothetical protein